MGINIKFKTFQFCDKPKKLWKIFGWLLRREVDNMQDKSRIKIKCQSIKPSGQVRGEQNMSPIFMQYG